MQKSIEEIGQLLNYEKLSAIHLLELPKIEKGDIPNFINCPKYAKAKNKADSAMERYQDKVNRCQEAIRAKEQDISEMERLRAKLDPGSGFFVDKSDGQAVTTYNDRLSRTRKMTENIAEANEKRKDLIEKYKDAVDEAKAKREELTLEALLAIDEDIVAVLDRCTKIVDKLDGSENIEDLIAAIDICLLELKIYAMFEDKIEGNDARKDCRERIAEVNQKFAALCANATVINYLVNVYQRNLGLMQNNAGICQQIVQVLGSVDQGKLTTLTQSIDTVLTENINTKFAYESIIDPAELNAIVAQINKTIDALKQSIAKANEAAATASEFAGVGVSTHQQAETLLTSMKSNVEALKNDILQRSHFASQMIEEAVIDNFYNKELRSAVTALRKHLIDVIGAEIDGIIGNKDRFSLEKAHNAIKQANLVRLKGALDKIPEHIKKTTDLIAAAETDIRRANEVPKRNAEDLSTEIGTKYIISCIPVFGCISAFGILGKVKAFESAFRSTNQIYRDLGNSLLAKNSKMTIVVLVLGIVLGLVGFFVLDLGVGISGAILAFYLITVLAMILTGKRLRSFQILT